WERQSRRIDQGFLTGYFSNLLDEPMFHPPLNGTKLDDLKLVWRILCGPNSVIIFPSAPWMKPWYWWSWTILPLGFSWHEARRETLGYGAEIPVVVIQALMYLRVMAVARLARPNLSKLCSPTQKSHILTNRAQVYNNVVNRSGLHTSSLPHPSDSSSTLWLVTLSARLFITCISCYQYFPSSSSSCLNTLAGNFLFPTGDGIPLVPQWGCKSTLCFCPRLLLCTILVGITGESSYVLAGIS
ncbi:hypothetical protein MKW92_030919, partial [Papaver armeniacum]